MFGAAAPAARPLHNPNGDVQVEGPTDGISSISWSPRANLFVATSWDNSAYCYELGGAGAQGKASTAHTAPIMCSAWHPDGGSVFLGDCNKQVKQWNLATNQSTQVAAHDAPIRHLAFVPEMSGGMLVTGSWDKTLRWWDTRQPNPAFQYALPERLYAMDVRYPLLVVGTADRQVTIFNLQNPQQPYKVQASPLKWQTRCLAAFPDKSGYLVGSIEGRVAVQHVEDSLSAKNFTFKCHRDGADIYSVNCIAFHPQFGTFATAGADGTYNFWDKDSKQRLKAMSKCQYTPTEAAPIPCMDFNHDGTVLAYALSYDWSKGFQAYNPAVMKNYIMLHQCQEAEVKARAKAPTSGRK